MTMESRATSSQWNTETEYERNDEAKEFGGGKKPAVKEPETGRDVFISYSSAEYAVAARMRAILQSSGITCWMAPEDIPGGSNYTKEIPTAIRGCQVFVLMMSEQAQSSHWVLKELNAAVNEGKLILPFMLENCELIDEFNFLLSGAQWFPAFQDPGNAMEKLTERVKAVLEPETSPAKSQLEKKTINGQKPKSLPVTEPKKILVAETEDKEKRKKKSQEQKLVCPACGSEQLMPIKKRGLTAAERTMRFWNTVFCIVLMAALWLVITGVCLEIGCSFGVYLGVLIVLLGICLILMLTIGRKRLRERIRRRRVRKHIRVSGARCSACAKEVTLTIADHARFPWE